MIDVAHDGDDRRASDEVFCFLGLLDVLGRFFFEADLVRGSAELARDFLRQFHVESLVNGRENLLFDQLLDDQVRFYAQLFGEFLHRDAFRNGDFAINRRRDVALLPFRRSFAEILLLPAPFHEARPRPPPGLP